MWREIEPDERIEVDVDGYKVVAYSFGRVMRRCFV
jgi:proline iminopeptidase